MLYSSEAQNVLSTEQALGEGGGRGAARSLVLPIQVGGQCLYCLFTRLGSLRIASIDSLYLVFGLCSCILYLSIGNI